MNEKKIAEIMTKYDCTREEAISVIEDDAAVDKMTMKELTADLTEEQRKAAKAATITTSGKPKKPAAKKERKPDDVKRLVIETLFQALSNQGLSNNINIDNPEKTISFVIDGDEFSVTLTKHRKTKK